MRKPISFQRPAVSPARRTPRSVGKRPGSRKRRGNQRAAPRHDVDEGECATVGWGAGSNTKYLTGRLGRFLLAKSPSA